MQRENQMLKLYDEGRGRQVCGTITLTFKFEKNLELPYNQKTCIRDNHILESEKFKRFASPIDLNIEYCYTIDEEEEVRLDVKDYYLDDISDFEEYKEYKQRLKSKTSKFFISNFTSSPDNRYIILYVVVEIKEKIGTQRIIIIDTINPNIKKIFLRTSFMGEQRPEFSKDGNFAFINITKNEKYSRFLILNLKNGIQEEKIIKLSSSVRKIDYDVQSGCLFYISFYCEIHKQPLDQDGTIDISKQKIYKIYLEPIDLSSYQITLTLLSDSIVLVTDDKGHLIVSRIRDNCKAAKLYLCNQYLSPQYTFNKAFVVMADSNSRKVALIDISRGKLIRSKYNANQYLQVYGYHQKDSYYISFESLSNCKQTNYNQVSVRSIGWSEIRKKWLIFDVIRGTEIEIQRDDSLDKTSDLFTRNITMRQYDNKISYQLKH
ncbi:unnamed protein product [Paramecium octaurelia]|uniref:Uncharacterized protein n=1 Tax=Paramecium octaurelia TaxID=43137 RepID=A0A8S1W8L4_PAROT|nr:unnamed protein product [Paramecium octaurelia]